MRPSQKLDLEIRGLRATVMSLGSRGDAVTDAEKLEFETLPAAIAKKEVEYRAKVIEEDAEAVAAAADLDRDGLKLTVLGGDAEARERSKIRGRTGLADFLSAAAGGREVSGAAREYAASVGCSPLNRLPLEIFGNGQPETRAISVGPAIDGPAEPAVPFVFQRSAAQSLGIQMPTHGPGQAQIPRVTTAVPSDTLAKDASAPVSAAVIALDSQSPKRISGQFEIRAEDLAVYPELEQVLMESIRGSLSNELDNEVFNGVAAGLNGLFLQAADQTKASTLETYATGIGRFAALVDGKFAYSMADLRCVVGSTTYAKYMGLISDGVPLADYLETKLGSFRVSNRMPALLDKGQRGIVTLNGGPSPIRIYVWNALEIVRDPYSSAGTGKVTITATALVSEVYIPHTTDQVKEIHPKLVA